MTVQITNQCMACKHRFDDTEAVELRGFWVCPSCTCSRYFPVAIDAELA
jgi:predicted  nucleic acid-binding Zn-ribbon protein